mmetsp:Transcript_12905/g.36565  ORF Transcript_12905/g.36565 Transcript_12905/m.36565 type:complete len:209 (+) Transcript_12905:846-1472(+)
MLSTSSRCTFASDALSQWPPTSLRRPVSTTPSAAAHSSAAAFRSTSLSRCASALASRAALLPASSASASATCAARASSSPRLAASAPSAAARSCAMWASCWQSASTFSLAPLWLRSFSSRRPASASAIISTTRLWHARRSSLGTPRLSGRAPSSMRRQAGGRPPARPTSFATISSMRSCSDFTALALFWPPALAGAARLAPLAGAMAG